MSDNEKLFEVFDHLKKGGLINTYVELATILGTNKAGINDLKSGKKKMSVENLRGMKNAYPNLSLDWFICNEGDMFKTSENYPIAAEPDTGYNNSDYKMTIDALNRVIRAQEKTISAFEIVMATKSTQGNTHVATGSVPG